MFSLLFAGATTGLTEDGLEDISSNHILIWPGNKGQLDVMVYILSNICFSVSVVTCYRAGQMHPGYHFSIVQF